MMARRTSSRALTLLERWIPDSGPLAGDLLERAHERSGAWLWRQVMFAIIVRATEPLRADPRAAAEQVLVAAAMLALLGFHAVVGATLMNHLAGLDAPAWSHWAGARNWQPYAALPAFAIAVVAGRAIGRFHRGHRVWTAMACATSATLAASLNLYLFAPEALDRPLVTELAPQLAAAMVFITGVFIGIRSRSTWEPAPSR